jgi:hypothetical protein
MTHDHLEKSIVLRDEKAADIAAIGEVTADAFKDLEISVLRVTM